MNAASIEIVTLCENTATFACSAEFGLSMYLNIDGYQVLFDTGMNRCATDNAIKLKVPLNQVDTVVLSHGHVDHTGGLVRMLNAFGPLPVLVHPEIWGDKFSGRRASGMEAIGMPVSQEILERMGAKLTFARSPVELYPNVFVSGEVPMMTEFESVDQGLHIRENDKIVNDMMKEELSLGIKTEEGLVVIVGCAHRGVINIIRHFQRITGEQRVYGVVGGFHLSHASTERVAKTIEALKKMGVKKVACSHCTGRAASWEIEKAFDASFVSNNSGMRLQFMDDAGC